MMKRALQTKVERETKAADRIFGLLPADQGRWFRELWDEFEAYESAEAKFAHVLDNCQPLLLNDASNGRSWAEHGIRKSQIYKRNEHTSEGSSGNLEIYAETDRQTCGARACDRRIKL